MLLLAPKVWSLTYVNHLNSQFAGEVGLISLGLGKDFTRYSVGTMYGIVPAEMSGGPTIETVTVRQTFRFYSWERISIYGGLNIFHVLGIKYRTEEYGETPDGYYSIGAFRGLLNLGTSVAVDKSHNKIFYFEAGYNDISLTNIFSNRKAINIFDELSLGMGFKQCF